MTRTMAAAALAVLPCLTSAPVPAHAAPAAQASEPTWREKREARRQARKQDAEEWRSAFGGLSPEDRATLATSWRNTIERIQDLTPEQRQKLLAGAERIGEELRNLSPEQKARLQERLQQSAVAYAALSAEQKQAMLAGLADSIERMRALTPAQKASLKALYRKLLGL
jgi:hypothetical protein